MAKKMRSIEVRSQVCGSPGIDRLMQSNSVSRAFLFKRERDGLLRARPA